MARPKPTTAISKIKESAEAPPGVPEGALTLEKYLQNPAVQREIAEALPEHLDMERLHRLVVTSIRQTPKLQQCSMPSIYAAIINAAQIGLEPGPMQHIAIVPRWNSYRSAYEAQLDIMYRGMLELARRSGEIADAFANVVYEDDYFDYSLGDNAFITHKPSLKPLDQRGSIIAAYFIAHLMTGGKHIELMPVYEIDDIRDRFGPRNRDQKLVGPWVSDYPEMARKTVTRRAFKYLPVSVEIQRSIAQDGTVKLAVARHMDELPDMSEPAEALRTLPDGNPAQEPTPVEKTAPRASEGPRKASPAKEKEPESDSDVDPASLEDDWACSKPKKNTILKLRKTLYDRYGKSFKSLGNPTAISDEDATAEIARLSTMLNEEATKGKIKK